MTQREIYARIATLNADDAEIVAFCNHKIEQLDNRKTGERKPTKNQLANETLKDAIYNALIKLDHPVTVTELITNTDELANYTGQKISALLRQLVLEERVDKTIEKGKALFAVGA